MKFQHNTELVLKERLICIAMNMLKSVPIAAHDKSVTTQAQSTNKTEFYHANLINNKQHYKAVIDVRLTNSLNSKKCCFHGFAKQCTM